MLDITQQETRSSCLQKNCIKANTIKNNNTKTSVFQKFFIYEEKYFICILYYFL